MLICVLTEAAARFGLGRISRIQRRIDEEANAALRVRRAAEGRPKAVLFIGNSLLLEGLDMGMLEAGLRDRYRPQRYVVEATTYYDWLYGLRRLFRGGMRPDTVVLSLGPTQLAASTTNGDYSARFLFGIQDIWPASRDAGVDLTTTSGYYAAHFSAYYAARSGLRAVLIGKLAPPVVQMWQESVVTAAADLTDEQLIPVIEPRLRKIHELCASYGTEFLFLVPPTMQPGDTAIVRAGDQAGVRVLRPVPNGSLPADYYQDGFHLNRQGAAVFTQAIVREMMR
jgi:hypothetical protein